MFLDDELYQHFTNYQINTESDIKKVMDELYKICESKWKPEFHMGMTKKDAKILVDRAFNSWDSFVRKLEKDKDPLAGLLKKYSYRTMFLYQPELLRIYKTL